MDGGDKGLFVVNEDGVVSTDISVVDNMLLNQSGDALEVGAIDELDNPGWEGEYAGVTLTGNTLYSPLLAPDEDLAGVGRHASFGSNCVESSGRGVSAYGNAVSTGTPDTFYRLNVLVADSEPLSYDDPSYLNDLQIESNVLSEPLDPAFAGGSGNLILGNAVDSGAICSPQFPTAVPISCSCAP